MGSFWTLDGKLTVSPSGALYYDDECCCKKKPGPEPPEPQPTPGWNWDYWGVNCRARSETMEFDLPAVRYYIPVLVRPGEDPEPVYSLAGASGEGKHYYDLSYFTDEYPLPDDAPRIEWRQAVWMIDDWHAFEPADAEKKSIQSALNHYNIEAAGVWLPHGAGGDLTWLTGVSDGVAYKHDAYIQYGGTDINGTHEAVYTLVDTVTRWDGVKINPIKATVAPSGLQSGADGRLWTGGENEFGYIVCKYADDAMKPGVVTAHVGYTVGVGCGVGGVFGVSGIAKEGSVTFTVSPHFSYIMSLSTSLVGQNSSYYNHVAHSKNNAEAMQDGDYTPLDQNGDTDYLHGKISVHVDICTKLFYIAMMARTHACDGTVDSYIDSTSCFGSLPSDPGSCGGVAYSHHVYVASDAVRPSDTFIGPGGEAAGDVWNDAWNNSATSRACAGEGGEWTLNHGGETTEEAMESGQRALDGGGYSDVPLDPDNKEVMSRVGLLAERKGPGGHVAIDTAELGYTYFPSRYNSCAPEPFAPDAVELDYMYVYTDDMYDAAWDALGWPGHSKSKKDSYTLCQCDSNKNDRRELGMPVYSPRNLLLPAGWQEPGHKGEAASFPALEHGSDDEYTRYVAEVARLDEVTGCSYALADVAFVAGYSYRLKDAGIGDDSSASVSVEVEDLIAGGMTFDHKGRLMPGDLPYSYDTPKDLLPHMAIPKYARLTSGPETKVRFWYNEQCAPPDRSRSRGGGGGDDTPW